LKNFHAEPRNLLAAELWGNYRREFPQYIGEAGKI
jgi:hypothetical protein